MKAKEVMTFPVISIEPRATILQAVQIMMRRHISGLPVIDKNGSLVGIPMKESVKRSSLRPGMSLA
jgi:CBS domain-containing protein